VISNPQIERKQAGGGSVHQGTKKHKNKMKIEESITSEEKSMKDTQEAECIINTLGGRKEITPTSRKGEVSTQASHQIAEGVGANPENESSHCNIDDRG